MKKMRPYLNAIFYLFLALSLAMRLYLGCILLLRIEAISLLDVVILQSIGSVFYICLLQVLPYEKRRFLWNAFWIEIPFPFFGIFWIFLWTLFYALSRGWKKTKSTLDVYDWAEEHKKQAPLKDTQTQNLDEKKALILRKQKLLKRLQISSYSEILNFGDNELKLSALDQLGKHDSPHRIEILKKALEDADYEIRFFANNQLQKIERDLMNQIDSEEKNLKLHPHEVNNLNSLGNAYLNLIQSNILDAENQNYFIQKALACYLFSLQIQKDQSDVILKIIALFLKSKAYQGCLALIESLRPPNSSIQNSFFEKTSFEDRFLFYQMECHFKLKNFSEVKKDAQKINRLNSSQALIRDICKGWNA